MQNSIPHKVSWLNLAIILVVIAMVSVGCESEPQTYETVQDRTLVPGGEVPTLLGNPIVAITGGAVSGDAQLADVRILESLGTVKYSVNDPYENKEIEYEGVLLQNLFEQFGGEGSTKITITATDDYQQEISRADAEKWPIMLALKADGAYAPKEHRGPSMIVYPYDQFSELEPTEYDQFWVWQIETLEFS